MACFHGLRDCFSGARHGSRSLKLPGQLQHAVDADTEDEPLRRLRKCESVLQRRHSRIVLVLERCNYSHNYGAVLRTAEALGVQHLWLIAPPVLEPHLRTNSKNNKKINNDPWEDDQKEREANIAYAKDAGKWLSLRFFDTTAACVDALRADGRTIWVTDLSQQAVCLTTEPMRLPKSLALVMGTESCGASEEILQAADLRVYLPLHGWTDSLNLSVASALVMQRLMDIDPTVVGDMPESERSALRNVWYPQMARTDAERERYTALLADPVNPFDDIRRLKAHTRGRTRLHKSAAKLTPQN